MIVVIVQVHAVALAPPLEKHLALTPFKSTYVDTFCLNRTAGQAKRPILYSRALRLSVYKN